jgi:hypothetical protein
MKRTDRTISSPEQSRSTDSSQPIKKGKASPWTFVAVALAAILTLSVRAKAHDIHGFMGQFLPLVVSTVPANGDQNPYGVVFVPFGFHGSAQPGDILVSNFNNAANQQGTGHTIVRVQAQRTTQRVRRYRQRDWAD